MSNDDQPSNTIPATGDNSKSAVPSVSTSPVPVEQEDRGFLLERARQFLSSPQVRYEDVAVKRQFLQEKGISEKEIQGLLHEQPLPMPLVPPRTYPQPTPSNLPNILAGILRIMSWAAGGSALILMIYYRFILPRLTQSALARRSLRNHQTALLSRLSESLQGFRDTQRDSFAVLPKPSLGRELPQYSSCQTVDEIVLASSGRNDLPEHSLLRCALADFKLDGKEPTTEELFHVMCKKLPWLEADAPYQERLWNTLNESPRFQNATEVVGDPAHWSFVPPAPPPPSSLVSSLSDLKSSLPGPELSTAPGRFQHTLQAMSDFTGYLTTETYTLSTRQRHGLPGVKVVTGIEEDEVRKEIRALKGLVLNRYGTPLAIVQRCSSWSSQEIVHATSIRYHPSRKYVGRSTYE
ncbi:hypothetical protein OF83DRAFT_1236464 [Amylostereum chailletii]|nr:hypothetical protein OF83DRAFT_1236464 [Amylostereum chailletii]